MQLNRQATIMFWPLLSTTCFHCFYTVPANARLAGHLRKAICLTTIYQSLDCAYWQFIN